DGIRDKLVTGVQTCALPISRSSFADAQALLKRVRPGVAQSFDRGLDDGVPPLFDAEAIAGDPAYFAGRQAVLSRNCEHGGKVFRRNGNDGASAAFAKDGVFRWGRVVDRHG